MLLFANKASGTSTGGTITGSTADGATITLGAGEGAEFVGVGSVATSSANPMRVVLTAVDANGNDTGAYEIVEVTRSGDTLTTTARGLEGTTAAMWPSGTRVECRPTAHALERSQNIGPANMVIGTDDHWVIPGVSVRGTSTHGPTANYLVYEPFLVLEPCIVTAIALEVVTAATAGATVRLGIARAGADWQPTALVAEIGTRPAIDSTGVKSVTGLSIALRPGRYLRLFSPTANVTVRRFEGGVDLIGFTETLGASPIPFLIGLARADAAFPDPPPAFTTASYTGAVPSLQFTVLRITPS